MTIYIGIDDTDTSESRGTGRLARRIAAELGMEFSLQAVTRHQLLVDPRIPYTSHNSSATIMLDKDGKLDQRELFERVRLNMLSDFVEGSDPGLCVATAVPMEIEEFGRRSQIEVVEREEAYHLAARFGLLLEGLGGDASGVIGALAAVGLAASQEDGRYLLIGHLRELSGLQPVEAVLSSGVAEIRSLNGERVEYGLILADKLRPARRQGRPIQYVTWQMDYWEPVKVD